MHQRPKLLLRLELVYQKDLRTCPLRQLTHESNHVTIRPVWQDFQDAQQIPFGMWIEGSAPITFPSDSRHPQIIGLKKSGDRCLLMNTDQIRTCDGGIGLLLQGLRQALSAYYLTLTFGYATYRIPRTPPLP